MVTLLWFIYILDCLFLIAIILLQPGEGSDLAAAFGGASSQTAFGARGSATFLQKVTTGAAILFMVLSVVLVIVTNLKQKNIMEKNLPAVEKTKAAEPAKPAVPPPAPTQAPAAPATQPAQTPATQPSQAQVPATQPAAAPAKPAPAPEQAPAPAGKEAPKPPAQPKK
jgi:preprotein translocase subunit SecG